MKRPHLKARLYLPCAQITSLGHFSFSNGINMSSARAGPPWPMLQSGYWFKTWVSVGGMEMSIDGYQPCLAEDTLEPGSPWGSSQGR